MPPPPNVPLHELNSAVQSAVERVLAQHGGLSIDKLWVGFVAPDQFATLQHATDVAKQISQQVGIHGTPSIAQIGGSVSAPGVAGAAATHGVQTEALQRPGHIIGLIYNPQLKK